MSRIGKKPVVVPAGVEVTFTSPTLTVKGPKGTLSEKIHPHVMCKIETSESGKVINFTVKDEENRDDRSLWGLSRALATNMVKGVTEGYKEQLEVNGIGFKVNVTGKILKLEIGFSHDINFEIPDGVTITVDKNIITIVGIGKQLVGETAARIRRFKVSEPYKGTGIRYIDEQVRRKAGKAATKAAS
ncbi:MAG: 50S ribosomal protein L6 [bacterium]